MDKEDRRLFNDSEIINNTLGVHKSPPPDSSNRDYALVFQCPNCFGIYWIHISEHRAKEIKEEISKKK